MVTTEGALLSKGVFTRVDDSCVGVVTTTVGTAVMGAIETEETHYTECGHENAAEKPCLSGVATERKIPLDEDKKLYKNVGQRHFNTKLLRVVPRPHLGAH